MDGNEIKTTQKPVTEKKKPQQPSYEDKMKNAFGIKADKQPSTPPVESPKVENKQKKTLSKDISGKGLNGAKIKPDYYMFLAKSLSDDEKKQEENDFWNDKENSNVNALEINNAYTVKNDNGKAVGTKTEFDKLSINPKFEYKPSPEYEQKIQKAMGIKNTTPEKPEKPAADYKNTAKNGLDSSQNDGGSGSTNDNIRNRIKEMYKPYFGDNIPEDFEFMNMNFEDMSDEQIEDYISNLNPKEDYNQWKVAGGSGSTDGGNGNTQKFSLSPDHIEEINDALQNPREQEIDLGDGLSLYIHKPRGYRSPEEAANATIDIIDNNHNSIIGTMDIFGTELDEDYQKELADMINEDTDYQKKVKSTMGIEDGSQNSINQETADDINKQLGGRGFEMPDGEYFGVEYKDGKLYAGGITNSGIQHEYEVDWDPDYSLDEHLEELYDKILQDHDWDEDSSPYTDED